MSTTSEGANAPDLTNLQESMPVIRMENLPVLSNGNATVDFSSAQLINIPVLQDGSTSGIDSQQSYILATSSDGNTILVDASQLAMLSEQTIPIYDGTNLFQLTAQSNSDANAILENIDEARDEILIEADKSLNDIIDGDEIQPPDKKGLHKCLLCKRDFANSKLLQRHCRTHAEEKPHRCDLCNASFNNLSNLNLHKATHSTTDFKCPECDRTFTRLASLKSHLMLHETEENLVCTECGDEFATQYKLDKHMEEHMKELVMDRSFVCRYCCKGFSKLSYLKDHMKMHYKIKASLNHRQYRKFNDRSKFPHKCYFCGKQFQKPSQLIRHNRIHTGERPFKCDVCSRAFNQKGALLIHAVKHTGARPFICEFCPAAFAQKGNLRNHIRRVHTLLPMETGDGVHKCELCTCVFRKLGSLNAHMSRAHSISSSTLEELKNSEDLSKCPKEVSNVVRQLIELSKEAKKQDMAKDAAFEAIVVDSTVSADILQQALENSGLVSMDPLDKSKPQITTVEDTATGTLRKHIMRSVGGVRWYQCIYCTKEFKKPSDLVRHIRIHTHERPFKCGQCYRAFAVRSTLNAHIRTHSGTKEFSCEHCKKLFSTSGSLKVHLLLHSGIKPFSCTLCDKAFRTSGHRNSHMASHQKDKVSKRCKQKIVSQTLNDLNVTVPLQEPILITDEGLVQPLSKNSAMYNELIKAKLVGGDRPYRCPMCEKGFKKSSHLKQHIRSHTGEKPFTCAQCQRSFVSNGVLKAHLRIHSGTKAYQCPMCDAAFTTNGSLKRHMSIHSNERPYMCPYCQKTFKTAMNCKKHMQTHRYELALGLETGVSVTVMSDGVAGVENGEETENVVSVTENSEIETQSNGIQSNETEQVTVVENEGETETVITVQDSFVDQDTTKIAMEEILPQHLSQEMYGSETCVVEQIEVVNQSEIFDQTPAMFSIPEAEFEGNQLTLQANTEPGEYVSSTTSNENLLPEHLSNIFEQQQPPPQETVVETTQAPNTETKPKEPKKQKFKRPFKCEQCPKTFKKTSHLKQHIISHTGEKSFWCTICGDMFSHNRVLKQHIKAKHDNIRDFKCSICGAAFASNYNLLRHINTHETHIYPFHCAYCSEKFMTKECYKLHLNEFHQIQGIGEEPALEPSNEILDEIPEVSESAPEKIVSDENIEISEQNIEKTTTQEQVPNNTGEAEKIFLKTLKESKSNRTSGRDYTPKQIHQCSQCPKNFKKPSDLVRHLRIHTGEKPYSCESCGKAFTVKSTLISHMKTHTGEKNFACHVCNSLFATKGSLKIHMRLHTGARPFKCHHCELTFRTSGHRKSHMASHFKERINRKRKISPAPDKEQLQVNNVVGSTLVALGEDVVNAFSSDPCAELPSFTSDSFQLPASLFSPNVQLTTIDPNTLLPKPFHIDASVLQQLQGLNFNITLNPTISEPQVISSKPSTDSNQNTQIINIDGNTPSVTNTSSAFTINPNMIIQGLGFTLAPQQQTDIPNSNNLTLILPGTSLLKNGTNNMVQTGELLETVLTVEEGTKESTEFIDANKSQEIFLNTPVVSSFSEVTSTQIVPEPVHVCNVCSKGFKTVKQLNNHVKVHNKPESIYHCEICDINFKLKNQLLKHLFKFHKVKN